jgi:diguanylate cyclase (GGDEF)-like protein
MAAVPGRARSFRTRVALRMFLLCGLCSLVPTVLIGVYVQTQIGATERVEAESALGAAAKGYGIALNERILQAEVALFDLAHHALAASDPAVPDQNAARIRDGRVRLLTVDGLPKPQGRQHPDEGLEIHDERLELLPLRDGDPPDVRVTLTVSRDGRAAQVSGLVPATSLWDDSLVSMPGTRFCVSHDGAPLSCTGEDPGEDRVESGWDLYLTPHFGESAGTWRIIAAQDAAVAKASSQQVLRRLPWIALGALLVALLLASVETRRTHQPLEQLLHGFRQMARGRFGAVQLEERRDEYGRIGAAYNRLSRTLRRQLRLLNALAGVDRRILDDPSVDALLPQILPKLPALLDCAEAAICIRDAAGRSVLRFAGARGVVADAAPAFGTKAELQSFLQRRLPHLRWSLRLILVGGQCRGALATGMAADHRPSRAARRAAAGFARRIAVALRNEEREQLLSRRAYFDLLTDLPNRRLMVDRMGQAIQRAAVDRSGFAICYLDMDRFKTLNDSLGHAAGDELLREVARRIPPLLGPVDTLARLGGDEFVILVPGADAQRAADLARRCQAALALPLKFESLNIEPQVSIGIALYPGDGEDAEEMLRSADAAMYRGKRQGGSRIVFFEESMNRDTARRLKLETSLRRALAEERLELHYQPKIRLADDAWAGVEALMRWRDPVLGVVSPAEFIPVAEDAGLIHELGRHALRSAARFARQCLDDGLPIGHVAVNVSMMQLRDGAVVDEIERLQREWRLPQGLLQIEVTESAIMDDAGQTAQLLARIRALGVKIAVDDFGTGYSSLALLQKLPVDTLKIDRAFVTGIEHDAGALGLLRAMLKVAQALHLEVVAEGVENVEQARLLAQEGCDIAQGYHYSAPLEGHALQGLLLAWSQPRYLQATPPAA